MTDHRPPAVPVGLGHAYETFPQIWSPRIAARDPRVPPTRGVALGTA